MEIDEIVQNLQQNGRPLLLLDTCALLDIVNAGFLENKPSNLIDGARRVREGHDAGKLVIVVAESVLTEFQRNIQNVTGKLEAEVEKLDKKITALRSAIRAAIPTAHFPLLEFKSIQHGAVLRLLAEQLLAGATVVKEDPECLSRGRIRNNAHMAPAKLKEQLSDCEILEHYLEISRRLQAAGAQEPRLLVTSNTSDFGKPEAPTPPIDADLASAGLTYVTNLNWAAAEAGL